MKVYRNASVDKNRHNLNVSSVIHQSYEKIRESLLSDAEAIEFLDQKNLFNLLNEVQEEILNEELQKEAEEYEREFNSIIDKSMGVCNVCDKTVVPFESGVICENCIRHFDGDV